MTSATIRNNILVRINSNSGNLVRGQMRIWKYAEIETWVRLLLVNHPPSRGQYSTRFSGGGSWNKASADNLWMLHEESNVSWNALDETVLSFLHFSTAKQHLLCICRMFLLLWWPHTLPDQGIIWMSLELRERWMDLLCSGFIQKQPHTLSSSF